MLSFMGMDTLPQGDYYALTGPWGERVHSFMKERERSVFFLGFHYLELGIRNPRVLTSTLAGP